MKKILVIFRYIIYLLMNDLTFFQRFMSLLIVIFFVINLGIVLKYGLCIAILVQIIMIVIIAVFIAFYLKKNINNL